MGRNRFHGRNVETIARSVGEVIKYVCLFSSKAGITLTPTVMFGQDATGRNA
jgi:hypothetical protein